MLIHKGYQGSHFDSLRHSSVNLLISSRNERVLSTTNVSFYNSTDANYEPKIQIKEPTTKTII